MDEKENFLGSAGGDQMQQRIPIFLNISPCKPLRSLVVPKKKMMYTKEFGVVTEERAKLMHPPPQDTENLNIATLDNVNTSSSSQAACQTHTPINDQEQVAFQTLMESNSTLEKKLHEKDEKLQELTSKCDHFQQIENLCSVLQTEVNLKNEQVEALEKTHVYLQQQADDSERKHSEELMSLVNALEVSTSETRARERLVQILARDLQKLKTNLERCKEELLRKDSKVKDLEEELKVMIRFLKKAQAERSSDAANCTQNVKVLGPQASNGSSGNKYTDLRQRNLRGEGRPWTCPESQLHSKRELQALVSKLKRKGEVWNVLEKSALISALEATEQRIPEKRAVDSDFKCHRDEERKKLKRVVTNSSSASTVRGSSPSYNHHHHHHRDDGHNQRHNYNDAAADGHHHQVQHHKFALCSVKALPSGKENHIYEDSRHHGHSTHGHHHHGHRGSDSVRSSALEQQLKQENQTLQARLKSLKRQLNLRLNELLAAQRERTEVAAKLAHVQEVARAMKGDMDRQVQELHVGLEEVSAERTTLRMVLEQRETSLSRLREGSVGGLMEKVELESSAATLQLKSNNLLHRAIQLRLGWHSCINVAQLTL